MHSDQYNAIFNDGERLIPGESHDLAEIVRHKSSYRFFQNIIEADIKRAPGKTLRILDLGCGVGHGTFALASLPNVEIVGIDPSRESIEYARSNYLAENISYVNADAEAFLQQREVFDYVVSRHALEHIENGLELARQFDFSRRIMINVPYREPEGNIHHKVHFIDESSFARYDDAEFFFEDMIGVTDTSPEKMEFANSIVCILTRDHSPKVADILKFPFAPWQPALQERIIIDTSTSVKQLQSRVSLLDSSVQSLANELEACKAQLATALSEIISTKAEVKEIRSMFLLRIFRKISALIHR
ncbi:methyltransferase domain-containing protein [Rhizobium sp. P44RR-XXIV]|uniref:class I SAM-dependent methyltransferase n=1 Tax=Rhizobium sp. P44RR-XXIV TaxID=1921145 RepID=UPI00098431F2|nr:methyltransferase domain-containing protein [Rhizobium sp. P44RR-XXIV]TIX87102.1 methyltransferase domain-containing protein [Rhizobium sp. P44RR-XXIV]